MPMSNPNSAILPNPEASEIEDSSPVHHETGSVVLAEAPLSCIQAAWLIGKMSVPRMLSYTFSAQIAVDALLLNAINSDKNHLAATTLISTLMNSIIGLGLSGIFSLAVEVSNLRGQLALAENDPEISDDERTQIRTEIAGAFKQGLVLGLIPVPFITACYFFSGDILVHLFKQDREVAQITQNFLRVFSVDALFISLRLCFEQVIFSFHHGIAAMIISLCSLAVGITVSVLLGFNLVGIPTLSGETGVAIGCVLEGYLTASFLALYLQFHPTFAQFQFFHFLKKIPDAKAQFWRLFTMGVSMFVSSCTSLALPLSTALMAGVLGVLPQSAWNFAVQLLSFTLIPILAFSQQACQEACVLMGKKNYLSIPSMSLGGLSALLFTLAPTSILAIRPNLLTSHLSTNAEQVSALLQVIMPIMVFSVFCNAVQFYALQQLRALGYQSEPTAISVVANLAAMGLAALLSFATNLDIYGTAIGYCLGLAGAAILLVIELAYYARPSYLQQHETQQHRSCCANLLNSFNFWSKNNTEYLPLLASDEEQVGRHPTHV